MRAIHFEGANCQMGKPADMTDEQCHPVSAYVGQDENGLKYVITCWQPNYEDLQALNAGRPLIMQMVGGMAPVALWTQDADGQANV